jgi:hypothetical protein
MMGLQYLRKDMARSISRDLYYLRKQAGLIIKDTLTKDYEYEKCLVELLQF